MANDWRHAAPLSRSSASWILARRACRLLALLALAFDHLLRRAGMKSALPSLASMRAMSALTRASLLLEPRLLGDEIDHAFERQRRDLAAHQELHRARRHDSRHRDVGEPRQSLASPRSSALRARLRRFRCADQQHRDRGGDVHLGAHRADGGDEIDHPADLRLRRRIVQARRGAARRRARAGSRAPGHSRR